MGAGPCSVLDVLNHTKTKLNESNLHTLQKPQTVPCNRVPVQIIPPLHAKTDILVGPVGDTQTVPVLPDALQAKCGDHAHIQHRNIKETHEEVFSSWAVEGGVHYLLDMRVDMRQRGAAHFHPICGKKNML